MGLLIFILITIAAFKLHWALGLAMLMALGYAAAQ